MLLSTMPSLPTHDARADHTAAIAQGNPSGAAAALLFSGRRDDRLAVRSGRLAMILSTALTTLLVVFPATAEVLMAPLSATSVALGDPPQPIEAIWAQELPAIKQHREETMSAAPNLKFQTELFSATIKVGEETYILSAFNDGCSFSETAPNEIGCTAKLARIQSDKVEVLATIPDFPILAVRGNSGYEGFSASHHTALQIDTATEQASYVVVEDGKRSETVSIPVTNP